MTMPKSTEAIPRREDLSPTKRTLGNGVKLGVEEVVFPRKDHTSWCVWSALNTYIQIAVYRLSRLYLQVYVYIHIYAITISKNEKKKRL